MGMGGYGTTPRTHRILPPSALVSLPTLTFAAPVMRPSARLPSLHSSCKSHPHAVRHVA